MGISADRQTITVMFVAGDGSCTIHAGYHVETPGSAMMLHECSTSEVPAGQACPAMLVCGSETTRLPLALTESVQLIHGPTSRNHGILLGYPRFEKPRDGFLLSCSCVGLPGVRRALPAARGIAVEDLEHDGHALEEDPQGSQGCDDLGRRHAHHCRPGTRHGWPNRPIPCRCMDFPTVGDGPTRSTCDMEHLHPAHNERKMLDAIVYPPLPYCCSRRDESNLVHPGHPVPVSEPAARAGRAGDLRVLAAQGARLARAGRAFCPCAPPSSGLSPPRTRGQGSR